MRPGQEPKISSIGNGFARTLVCDVCGADVSGLSNGLLGWYLDAANLVVGCTVTCASERRCSDRAWLQYPGTRRLDDGLRVLARDALPPAPFERVFTILQGHRYRWRRAEWLKFMRTVTAAAAVLRDHIRAGAPETASQPRTTNASRRLTKR